MYEADGGAIGEMAQPNVMEVVTQKAQRELRRSPRELVLLPLHEPLSQVIPQLSALQAL